jgi:hypothetical protein
MKIREIFNIGGLRGSFTGPQPLLDRNDCEIYQKNIKPEGLALILRRKEDGLEGKVSLKVKDEFNSLENILIKLIYNNEEMIGLTLNQLDDLETGINITETEGRMSIENL